MRLRERLHILVMDDVQVGSRMWDFLGAGKHIWLYVSIRSGYMSGKSSFLAVIRMEDAGEWS